LKHNHGDGHQVGKPEPGRIDPVPLPCVSDDDNDKPADHKQYYESVKNEDQISERLVHGGL